MGSNKKKKDNMITTQAWCPFEAITKVVKDKTCKIRTRELVGGQHSKSNEQSLINDQGLYCKGSVVNANMGEGALLANDLHSQYYLEQGSWTRSFKSIVAPLGLALQRCRLAWSCGSTSLPARYRDR